MSELWRLKLKELEEILTAGIYSDLFQFFESECQAQDYNISTSL